MKRYKFDYNPSTGMHKDLVWSSHCPEQGTIHTYQTPHIRTAILENNKRLLQEEIARTDRESVGLVASIPMEDYLDLENKHPELKGMSTLERSQWFDKYWTTDEGKKYCVNPGALNTGRTKYIGGNL